MVKGEVLLSYNHSLFFSGNQKSRRWAVHLNLGRWYMNVYSGCRGEKWQQTDQVDHFSSVAQLWLTLQPHGLQHTRLSCPLPTSGTHSNSCPSSQWCHPTISSSVVPFSSCFQSFPASGTFPVSQLFASGGQSVRASASASVLPMNIQDWFPLGLAGLISLQFEGFSRVFSNTAVQEHQFVVLSSLYSPTLTSIHDYWKNQSFD